MKYTYAEYVPILKAISAANQYSIILYSLSFLSLRYY